MLTRISKLRADLVFPKGTCTEDTVSIVQSLVCNIFGTPLPRIDVEVRDNTAIHFVMKTTYGFSVPFTFVEQLAKATDCLEAEFYLLGPMYPEGMEIAIGEMPVTYIRWKNGIITAYTVEDALWRKMAELNPPGAFEFFMMLFDLQVEEEDRIKSVNKVNPCLSKCADHIVPRPTRRQYVLNHLITKVTTMLQDEKIDLNSADKLKIKEVIQDVAGDQILNPHK